MVLAFVRDVTEHYWRKYYKRKEGAPDAGPVVHGVSFFSLTWQRRAGDFVFIGYDQKATVATKGLIKNFMGKTVRRIYGYRTDLLDDFERCYREKALIRRKRFTGCLPRGKSVSSRSPTYSFPLTLLSCTLKTIPTGMLLKRSIRAWSGARLSAYASFRMGGFGS